MCTSIVWKLFSTLWWRGAMVCWKQCRPADCYLFKNVVSQLLNTAIIIKMYKLAFVQIMLKTKIIRTQRSSLPSYFYILCLSKFCILIREEHIHTWQCPGVSFPSTAFGGLKSVMVAVFISWKLATVTKHGFSLPTSCSLSICQCAIR